MVVAVEGARAGEVAMAAQGAGALVAAALSVVRVDHQQLLVGVGVARVGAVWLWLSPTALDDRCCRWAGWRLQCR